jgi:hypothetical protein
VETESFPEPPEDLMRRRIWLLLFTSASATAACGDHYPTLPLAADPPAFDASACELGLDDAEAIGAAQDLIAAIDALEADGKLSAGQAIALRAHLESVIHHIEEGRYCPALVQLAAFQQLIGNFVNAGTLDPADAAALTAGAVAIVEGPPPGPATYSVTLRTGQFNQVTYTATGASFGPEPTAEGVTATLALVDDGSADPTHGCGPLIGFPADAIAVVDRGSCTFVEKANHAQAAGAVAMIVVNHTGGDPITMGGTDPNVVIPSVMVSLADGTLVQAALPTFGTVSKEEPPSPIRYVTVHPDSPWQVVFPASRAVFGPELTPQGMTADIAVAEDAGGDSRACVPLVDFPAGAIALVDSGDCTFEQKAKNVQDAGGIAMIVARTVPGEPINMGGSDPDITIPSVMVSLDNGDAIRSHLPAIGTVSKEPPPTPTLYFLSITGNQNPGLFTAIPASFGPEPTVMGVSGPVALVNDGSANPTQGCEPLVGFPAGAIALVESGGSLCTFVQKANNAQAAGAVAMVVIHPTGKPVTMGGEDPDLTIPSVMISFDDGNVVKASLPAIGVVYQASP